MGRRLQTSRSRGSLAELWELVGDYEAAVATTRSRTGMPRVRPISLENPAALPGSDLWFITSLEAEGHGGLTSSSTVGICCYGAEGGGWLSIAAVARLDDDRVTIHRLWQPDWREQLPGGPEDPDVVLVRLYVLRAEQWDPVSGHLRVVYDLSPDARSTLESART